MSKEECTYTGTNPIAFILVSKYMIRKYGLNEALKRAQADKRVKIHKLSNTKNNNAKSGEK